MSAKDIFHEAVKQALQKEQWVITDDPLRFQFGNVNFRVDLGAERLLAAEREGEKIAVEIKSLQYQVLIIVYDPASEVIVQWTK